MTNRYSPPSKILVIAVGILLAVLFVPAFTIEVRALDGYGTVAVSRFYNSNTGGHFYTISQSEREKIQTEMHQFKYEPQIKHGLFAVWPVQVMGMNTVPVYRFYNSSTAAHFYTINQKEAEKIINNLPQFKFEGVAFYVFETDQGESTPVYRFYNTSTSMHFYTVSRGERDKVMNTLPQFKYEGIAFYAV